MLQSQVDAGVLAAATVEIEKNNNGVDLALGQYKKAREEAANRVISANGFDMNGIEPVLTIKEQSVVLKAELDYKPAFGGILGINKIRLTANAESGLPGQDGVDIALVLDNTDSMRVDGKMEALKEGAIGLVEAIEDSGSESKISLVPFARYVRLNESVKSETWFKMPDEYDTERTWQQATHTGGTCSTVTETHNVDGVDEDYETERCEGQTTTYEEKSTTVETRWDGCVGTRLPPYNERDDAYSHKIPGLPDKIPHERTDLSYDVNSWCPAEIKPLSIDYEQLKNHINSMWTTDNTYLPSGLIWGQRVLSAAAPFDNKPEAGNPVNRKVMVLMTDGNNTTEIVQASVAENEYRAPPFISNGARDEVMTQTNATTARLCANAKAAGIEVYTIAFKVPDATTKALLKSCASDPSKAMTAGDNTALVKTFEKVAEALKEDIRLMR